MEGRIVPLLRSKVYPLDPKLGRTLAKHLAAHYEEYLTDEREKLWGGWGGDRIAKYSGALVDRGRIFRESARPRGPGLLIFTVLMSRNSQIDRPVGAQTIFIGHRPQGFPLVTPGYFRGPLWGNDWDIV